MKTLRFKRKTYGRGRTPASRQGWLVLILYLILDIGWVSWYTKSAEQDQLVFSNNPDAGGNLLVLLVPVVILTALLLIICYHTGEKPKWQWGEKKDTP